MSEEEKNRKESLYLDTAELLRLRETDYDAFIDKLYETIVENESDALEDNVDSIKKAEAVQVLIDYYSGTEEYERCQKLFDLQKKMKGE